ncbi:phosphonate C-P lyase system protein PhnG [Clostridium vincentii]|uniref:Phosphonate metabolism protein PhnG n=1 Tax=Clostridium vincentii TaxID=52704 RepID=A0A2T0BKG0_9CLOT|nr:phosphonate C-P lyase system protein PhnG [Clostridium vincentii]PRR84374.1 Phosphonate metabolism protein PhnG [Clostridium vincentii]
MNRRKRTEILIKSRNDLAKKLADDIKDKYEIKEIEAPNHGLVMIKIRETAKKELFYLGEIFVSEAKVYIEGVLGLGIVAGDREELALNLAIIDGACKKNLEETGHWEKFLLEEEAQIREREKKIEEGVLKTKVDFTTMDI